MFDHVVLRRATGGSAISAGQIAEALFYYQKVQLFLDTGTVQSLVKQLGTVQLINLLGRHDVSAVFCEEVLGTHSEAFGVSLAHNFVAMSFIGNETAGELRTPQERLEHRLRIDGLPKGEAQKFVKRFFDRVLTRKLSGSHFIDGGVTSAAQRDVLDEAFLKSAVRHAVSQTDGGYDPGEIFTFDVIHTDLGNFVSTNIDLDAINRRRNQTGPSGAENFTVAHLLTAVLDARVDMALASYYGGDFVTSALTSSIIHARQSELLRRTRLNTEQQRGFIEIILPDTPGIAEVIDSGQRAFDEFSALLERATRFKRWLKSTSPDEGLVRSYICEISREAAVDSIPSKTLRYCLATAIGDVGFTVGAVAGFVDTFLADKLLGGWRPNHFVEKRFVPFLKT